MVSDNLALLAAVRANPDEDTPRLMYADEIESADPARAELIRVQCELARFACETPSVGAVIEGKPAPCFMCRPRNGKDRLPWCASCRNRDNLMTRERELLAAHAARWRKGPVCDDCQGGGLVLSHVHANRRKRCIHCYGSGDEGGLCLPIPRELTADENLCADIEGGYRNRVEYRRGMKRVHTLSSDVWGDHESVWRSVWRPTQWAKRVCTHHPDICELRLRDSHPEYWTGQTRESWSWFIAGLATDAATIPEPVFDLLTGWDDIRDGRKMWFDLERASVALARAVAMWVYEAAR